MDLSKLNVTAASDKARRMVIVSPYDFQPVKDEDGAELAMWLLGHKSTVARNKRAEQKKELPPPPGAQATTEQQEQYLKDLQELDDKQRPELMAALVTELEGKWEYNGNAVSVGSKALIEMMRNEQELITEPAQRFVTNLGNYRPQT